MDVATWIVLAAYAAVVIAGFVRNRQFGIFALVILGFPTWGGITLREHLGLFGDVVPIFQLLADAHFAALLISPRMRPQAFRWLVSVPALWFVAGTLVALPWIIVAAFGWTAWGAWIPYVLATAGLRQTLWTAEETIDVRLDNERDAGALARYPEIVTRTHAAADGRPLTIVQITDPHLGPFMSVARLRKICERAVEREPDLILVTGDLMTMESQDVGIVHAALEPLARAKGKVFACHGNHDLEAREVVSQAYTMLGVTLLVDEATVVQTAAGSVQLIGSDFVWRNRDVHMKQLCELHPRVRGALRVLLLHDPGAFRHLPEGEGDLVLSGHTHGGQVGLISLGLRGTFLSALSKIPDHGMWARGRDRLYVHRAQGVYGFPLRIGVPGEQSLMRVFRAG